MPRGNPNREILSQVGAFCQKYGYAGACWDGKNLTCYFWRSGHYIFEDTLEPLSCNRLAASLQQSKWISLESKLEKYHPFAWGAAMTSVLPQTSQIPD